MSTSGRSDVVLTTGYTPVGLSLNTGASRICPITSRSSTFRACGPPPDPLTRAAFRRVKYQDALVVKLPEPLFAVINPIVRFLLRSPAHMFLSESLMLITFTGRKSHRQFTTPVRYVRVGNTVRCFTSSENLWWRNLKGGADVVLRLKGREIRYHAMAIDNDPAKIRQALEHYLGIFPQDAAYHDIRLNRDKSLVSEDLERASINAVVVEATPI